MKYNFITYVSRQLLYLSFQPIFFLSRSSVCEDTSRCIKGVEYDDDSKKKKEEKKKKRILAPGRDLIRDGQCFSLLEIHLSVAQNATCRNSLQGLAMFDVDNAGRKQIEHLSWQHVDGSDVPAFHSELNNPETQHVTFVDAGRSAADFTFYSSSSVSFVFNSVAPRAVRRSPLEFLFPSWWCFCRRVHDNLI